MTAEGNVPPSRGASRVSYNSSSPGLSTPPSPQSPPNATHPPDAVVPSSHILPSQKINGEVKIKEGKSGKSTLAKPGPAPKKPRRKRDPTIKLESNRSSTATGTDGKEALPKIRKPRSGTSSTAGRKKKAVETDDHRRQSPAPNRPHPAEVTDRTRSPVPLPQLAAAPSYPLAHQNGNHEAIARSRSRSTEPTQIVAPTLAPRASSGQIYDPIRSATMEASVEPLQGVSHHAQFRASTPTRPPLLKYPSASASPSIASLIEPPGIDLQHHVSQPMKRLNEVVTTSPPAKKPRLSPPALLPAPQPSFAEPINPASNGHVVPIRPAPTTTLDMDHHVGQPPPDPAKPLSLVKEATENNPTTVSSATHSPKPVRPKETPAVLPSGNGLLSSAVFGGAYDSTVPEKTAPTVILHVSLEGGNNKYVNFARMAEEQYGFNALHPRLAAHREKLARVAAGGAAFETAHKGIGNSGSGISGDEMSVDLSENDGAGEDSNIELGANGPNDLGRSGGEGSEGTVGKKVPRKRMMKEDQYDKDDPFVDDTELAWEEQAAASKDGFFVFSGPLVPEGEKANIERTGGPPKRGRGRGSRGGSRGGGRGANASSRSAPTQRKPRVTKAAKEVLKQEIIQRESMAVLAAKPTGYPG